MRERFPQERGKAIMDVTLNNVLGGIETAVKELFDSAVNEAVENIDGDDADLRTATRRRHLSRQRLAPGNRCEVRHPQGV